MHTKWQPLRIVLILGLAGSLLVLWFMSTNLFTQAAQTAELLVCLSGCPYASIQAAVDDAVTGDVIKVEQGTYTGVHQRNGITQVVYISTSITLQGGYVSMEDFMNPPDPWLYPTIIDAQDQGRVIYIAEDITVTLEGMQLVGGNGSDLGGGQGLYPDAGGGIYLDSATAIISDCLIADNRSPIGGGGYANRGTMIMQNSTISANTAISGNGGGVYFYSAAYMQFTHNIVTSNTAGFNGGGLYIAYGPSDSIFSDNVIISNTTSGSGGGIFMASAAQIRNNDFSDNTAGHGGGGLYINGRDPTVAANTLSGNQANYGGAIYLNQDALLQANTVISNTADRNGAGILIYNSDGRLESNIVAQNYNSDDYAGNGIFIWGGAPTLLHTTIAENVGGDGTCMYVRDLTGTPSDVVMKNTILVSQTVGIYATGGSTVTMDTTVWGSAMWANVTNTFGTVISSTNLACVPGFVDPQTTDYHIGSESCAVNAGVDAGVYIDIDSQTRVTGSIDIGADEFWWLSHLPLLIKY